MHDIFNMRVMEDGVVCLDNNAFLVTSYEAAQHAALILYRSVEDPKATLDDFTIDWDWKLSAEGEEYPRIVGFKVNYGCHADACNDDTFIELQYTFTLGETRNMVHEFATQGYE